MIDWEIEEARERRRHAVWLVEHGADPGEVARAIGVNPGTLGKWVKRYGGTK